MRRFPIPFFLCVCVCLPPPPPPPPPSVAHHRLFFSFFFCWGKKREKKCFEKNVSKEREETHKNLCTYYTLSLSLSRRHTEICRALLGRRTLLLRLTPVPKAARAFENTTQRPSSDPTHERDDDDDDDAPERRFTNDDAFVSGTTTTTVRRVPTKVVAKRRHAFRRDDVLHRL